MNRQPFVTGSHSSLNRNFLRQCVSYEEEKQSFLRPVTGKLLHEQRTHNSPWPFQKAAFRIHELGLPQRNFVSHRLPNTFLLALMYSATHYHYQRTLVNIDQHYNEVDSQCIIVTVNHEEH